MAGMRFDAQAIRIGRVKVGQISDGHAAMMPVILRSKRGVNDEKAVELVIDAREIAARYPGDGEVLAALAEAEFDAGNDDAAIAAATAAVATDPGALNAYVQQGYALFRKAADAPDKAAAFAAAMRPFEALNAIEADHTQPLIYYYRSFTRRGETPPEGARHAIERASQLAPFDQTLAIEVALLKAAEGESGLARYLLAPVAADPHGGKRASAARNLMDQLASVPEGRRFVVTGFDPEARDGDEDDEGDGG